jgi:hypothetical protein
MGIATVACAPADRFAMEGRTFAFESPLHEAVWGADAERVAQLLAQGEDPNRRFHGGTTPLMVAAQFGHESIAAALVTAGADVNAQDDRGATALMGAAAARSIPVVSLLVKAGADPNVRTLGGRSALSESRLRCREFHIGKWFFIWKTKVRDDDELVRLLVEAGAKS